MDKSSSRKFKSLKFTDPEFLAVAPSNLIFLAFRNKKKKKKISPEKQDLRPKHEISRAVMYRYVYLSKPEASFVSQCPH